MKSKIRNSVLAAWLAAWFSGPFSAQASIVLTDANEYVGADASEVSVLLILLCLLGLALVVVCLVSLLCWLRRRFCPASRCKPQSPLAEDELNAPAPARSAEASETLAFKNVSGGDYGSAWRWSLRLNPIPRTASNRTMAAGSGTGTKVSE